MKKVGDICRCPQQVEVSCGIVQSSHLFVRCPGSKAGTGRLQIANQSAESFSNPWLLQKCTRASGVDGGEATNTMSSGSVGLVLLEVDPLLSEGVLSTGSKGMER